MKLPTIAFFLVSVVLLAMPVFAEASNDASAGEGVRAKVLSFNIRYGTARDGENAWEHRTELVFDVIRRGDYDFLGLQEALRYQIDAIHDGVPGYEEIGVGRDDGKQKGEYSAILYRGDRWQCADHGTFWLSDTPPEPGSRSWGNQIPRIVTWGRFVDRDTGCPVYVFNTHFDHQSQPSREKSAELLAQRIAQRETKAPVIVTGDFNAAEDNPAIMHLRGETEGSPIELVDSFRVLHPEAQEVGTFHGFRGGTGGGKIDYVFIEAETKVVAAEILHDNEDGRYPSDHYPVMAELLLPCRASVAE